MASVNVSNFPQLKAAIEDASSTEIIVNDDIIFESGAKVNFDKSNLIIDFLGHSVTDSSSLSISSTIYVAATTKTVEVTADIFCATQKNSFKFGFEYLFNCVIMFA